MIRYEFRQLDADTAGQLIALSRLWVEENCSHGMVENTIGDLKEPLAVAVEEERIVGYTFGHFYQQETASSYIGVGQKCFSVDELYVLPEYRGSGIGQRLYRMLEKKVAPECSYLTLATSTKNYKAILNLYVDILKMDFHSAFLIKKTAQDHGEEE